MLKGIKKILSDTLMNPDKTKFSRKSLNWFVSLLVVLVMWVAQQFFEKAAPEYMFFGFLGMAAGMGILSVWDKLNKS